MNDIIRADRLTKDYGNGNVLTDVDLTIEEGEFAAVMGQSGCGKSTLLYCISGMDKRGRTCRDLLPGRCRNCGLRGWGLYSRRPAF